MRTTITLEDDVAALVKRAMKERRLPLRAIVNEGLRAGLAPAAGSAGEAEAPFRTRTFEGGRCLIGSLDSVGEVLAVLEGDTFK